MPAEGAMRTEVEAPGVEPRDVSGGVTVASVGKAFGAVQALDGVALRADGRGGGGAPEGGADAAARRAAPVALGARQRRTGAAGRGRRPGGRQSAGPRAL